jgi:hypothetical protein
MNSKYVEWNIKMAEHIHYGHQHNNHQEQHEQHQHQGHDDAKTGEGHDHSGHTDHSGHEMMFRDRFWVSLVLTIPVLIFSPMIQEWFGFASPEFTPDKTRTCASGSGGQRSIH